MIYISVSVFIFIILSPKTIITIEGLGYYIKKVEQHCTRIPTVYEKHNTSL